MTNTKLLRKKINESGYKLSFVARQIGITYAGLLKKLKNETEFKIGEVRTITLLLNLTQEEVDDIFFAS